MLKPLTVWITINWKILQEIGIPDHLTCLLRNLYAGQEAAVRIGHGITGWFQIGKGVHQGCIFPPCLLNLYAGYILRNAGLDESQVGIRNAGRNISNLRYVDDTTLMAESEEELKSLLIWVKRRMKKLAWNSTFKKWRLCIWPDFFTANRRGKSGSSDRFSFLELQKHCRWWQQSGN